jgi:Uma2 family endonuclease
VGRIAARSKLSSSEYLAWEREQPEKHEFFDGEIFAMAGGSLRHNALSSHLHAVLAAQLRGQCTTFTSDQRIGLEDGRRYVYPDLSVVCGGFVLQPDTTDVILNPTIIVEVLSASTEQYDRGLKWEGYQRIGSLTSYVLVSQAAPRIELFRREHAAWSYRAFGPGESMMLNAGVELSVDAVYFSDVFQIPGD